MDRRRILAAAAAVGRRYLVAASPSPWSATLISVFVRSGAYANIVTEASASNGMVMSEVGKASGKYYWEMDWTGSTGTFDAAIGIRRASEPVTSQVNVGQTCTLRSGAQQYNGSSGATIGPSTAFAFAATDTLCCALDLDNNKFWMRKGSTWPASADPAAGTNPMFSGFSGTPWHIFAWCDNNAAGSHKCTLNTGFSPFTYAVPAGFTPGLPM